MSNKLPPGWTEAQLKKATVDDVQKIALEDCLHLDTLIIEDETARRAATDRFIQACDIKYQADKRAERTAQGLPPEQPQQAESRNVDPLIQVIERRNLDEFGFLFFRLDYSDDARWESWEEECDDLIQESLHTVAGIEYIADTKSLQSPMIKDIVLAGRTVRDVYSLYPNCYDAGDVTEGVDLSMCLAVDKDAVASTLEPTEDQVPWVWAVDLNFDPDQYDVTEEQYPGYFKVAISSLIPDLWPLLASDSMTPRQLWSFATPIWKGAL